MPLWKYVSNRFLTLVENILLGVKLSEYHTGYRAFARRVLETLPLEENSDDFVFDNEMLAQAVAFLASPGTRGQGNGPIWKAFLPDDAYKELVTRGAYLKDPATGLLDFYTWRGDEIVFLCWKDGEDTIGYWHGLHDGFLGRAPLEA